MRFNYQRIIQYNSRQWFINCFLINCKQYGPEFLDQNPALAFLIASHGVFRKLKSRNYWRSARNLIRKKRRDILEYFGFPNREAAVKILNKVETKCLSVDLLFWVRKTLWHKPNFTRRLSFLSSINETTIRLLSSDLANIVTNRLLEEISTISSLVERWNIFFKISKVKSMKKVIENNQFLKTRIPCIDSLAKLDVILNRYLEVYDAIRQSHSSIFPACSLPDISRPDFQVEQIQNSFQLQKEGEEMCHCIYNYNSVVKNGSCHVARVLKPERATVLFNENNAQFQMIEAKGKYNKQPSKEVILKIESWLSNRCLDSNGKYQSILFDEF